MSLNFKYPFTKADGSEFKSATELFERLNGEPAGFYLLSAHGFWHGGLHISDATCGYLADARPIRAMATGEVVAYRLDDDYRTSTWGEGADAQTLKYSTSFCLIRHRYESPHKPAAAGSNTPGPQNTLVFYSLYMHLLPYIGYAQRVIVQGNSAFAYASYPGVLESSTPSTITPPLLPEQGSTSLSGIYDVLAINPAIPLPPGTELSVLKEARSLINGQITKLIYAAVSSVPTTSGIAPLTTDSPSSTPALAVGQRYWIVTNGVQLKAATGAAIRERPAYWECSGKLTGTLLGVVNARGEPAGQNVGAIIHTVPPGTTVEILQERLLKQGNNKKPFAQVTILTLGTGDAGTIAVGSTVWIGSAESELSRDPLIPDRFNDVVICTPPRPIDAGATMGYLGLYETPGPGVSDKVSRQQVHLEVFTGDSKFDDFFANAAGLTDGKKYKVAGTDGAPAREETSAAGACTFTPGTDSLLLPVVVDTSPSQAKQDAQHKKWFPVEGIGEGGVLTGWVAEDRPQDVVQYDWEKLGFRKVEEANANADGYMDPEQVPDFFKKIYKLIDQNSDGDVTPDELIAANHNPVVRNALAHVVAKHPSEWQGKSDAAKWSVLKEKDALLKNDPKRLKHEQERIDNLAWWDDICDVQDFPASPNVWHLNSLMFVDVMAQKECECGCCMGKIFNRNRWVRHRPGHPDVIYYGPVYNGARKLDCFAGWNELILSSQVTEDEKEIVIAMSSNEGAMDAVQAWDWQTFSAGAMQKTVNPEGFGELPRQMFEFKNDNPSLFEELFGKCGWSIKNESGGVRIYYRGEDTGGLEITGQRLYDFVKNGFGEHDAYFPKKSPILASIAHGIIDPQYQKKQVVDFVDRMRKAIAIVPTGYTRPASEYFLSKRGRALVLDQSVNAPANISRDIGRSIVALLSHHPGLSSDPAQWGDNRSQRERELIEIYGPTRTMNSPVARYNSLIALL